MQPYCVKKAKPWGYELLLSPSQAKITAKILHLNQGSRFSLQYHQTKTEVLTLSKGEALITVGTGKDKYRTEKMAINQGYFIGKGIVHRCTAVTDCEIFEASTPETGTTVRLEDDYNRDDQTDEERKAGKDY